jgi:hypothetical protein
MSGSDDRCQRPLEVGDGDYEETIVLAKAWFRRQDYSLRAT